MRGLALQSMHRKIAVVAARSWADSFLRRMGRYAPRALTTLLQPHHPATVAVQVGRNLPVVLTNYHKSSSGGPAAPNVRRAGLLSARARN